MEEKERFVIRYDLDYNQCLIDTEKNQGVGDYIKIVKLLNQQSKRIKELEKKLDIVRQKDIIIRQNCRQGYVKDLEEMNNLVEENQQLKQQLEETKQNDNYQVMLMCSKENVLLKQQLHDLPKKIVGEIKKELYDCGKTYLEDEPYIEICIVQGILNTILKKYGGGDE